MITNYLELTTALAERYLKISLNQRDEILIEESKKYNQLRSSHAGETCPVVCIAEVNTKVILVSFVFDGKQVESRILNWEKEPVVLPVGEITSELDEKFSNVIGALNRPVMRSFENVPQQEPRDDHRVPKATDHTNPYGLPDTAETTSSRYPQVDLPKFEDEYDILSRRTLEDYGNPFPSIGDRDLRPPGIPEYPQMKPYIDPTGGETDGGGMYPLRNHPIFGPKKSGPFSRRGVPPGARYDDPSSNPFGEPNPDEGIPPNYPNFGGGPSGGPGGSSFPF